MSLSMYHASIPVFLRMLGNLAAILDKAEQHAHDHKIAAEVLLGARLAPDMYPLTRQVQIASDAVKGCAARLAGIEVPSFADTESSFAELQARIGKTCDFLRSVSAQQLDGSESRAVSLSFPGLELRFSGQDYLLNFVLPNVYFHLSIAYAILRHNGVPLGKMDFLGHP
jgi:hypothetical protein